MFIPCVCVTCRFPIGDIADIFYAEVKKKEMEFNSNEIDKFEDISQELESKGAEFPDMQVNTNIRSNLPKSDHSDIFDKLFVSGICCRMIITTAMNFSAIH